MKLAIMGFVEVGEEIYSLILDDERVINLVAIDCNVLDFVE